MQVIAHRGNSCAAPENTMAAFRPVAGTGAAGVEFDVQSSRDGVPVIIHDEALRRTTGAQGQVGERTLEELKALDAGRWLSVEFAGERIPTLAEVLEWFRQTSLQINIELKTNRVTYPGLAARVLEQVRGLKLEQQVVISSYNHETLREARALAPGLTFAALASDQILEPWDYVRSHGFQAFHPRATSVTEELVQGCHRAGLAVRAWTVDDVQQALRLQALGVDAVFSNHPARLVQALAGRP